MKFSLANSMIGLGAGLIIPLIPTWFYLRFNVTDVFSGPLIAASNIIMGLTAVAAPSIAKRVGLVKGIVTTQLLSTIFLLLIPFSPTATVAGPLYVVRAVLMNMSSPLGDTFLMNMIAEDERAMASSFNVVVWRLPNAASTVVGGDCEGHEGQTECSRSNIHRRCVGKVGVPCGKIHGITHSPDQS